MPEILTSGRVRLRPITDGDADRTREILSTAEVSRWWGDPAEQLAEILYPPDEVTSFAIEVDATMVGIVQCAEELTPQYKHAGIDIAIHPDWHGRGIGSEAIHVLATHLIRDRGHHRLTIDPAADNEAAIRVYRRLGFRPVGIMRQYERGTDGTWHDGLLMDMLAHELEDIESLGILRPGWGPRE